jgi:AGZA family xanthine/uracil permease-like MFS transporter
MGLNAYFTYSVVLGLHIPWQTALGAVFISGIAFVLLSLAGVRQAIVDAIPSHLKLATSVGIGLFLAIIGCESAGLIQAHPATLVTLGALTTPEPLLAIFGLILTACLLVRRVPGALLIGIGATTGLAMATGAPVFGGQAFTGFTHGLLQAPAWPTDIAFALDIPAALHLGAFGVIFIFLFVDLFDTAGSLMGLSQRGGFLDADGRLPRAEGAFAADAIGTACSATLGSTSMVAYIESAAGIEEGGRTGLTALVVAGCFALSIFAAPLAGAVPAVATAPVLLLIGAMMMGGAAQIGWDDYATAIPAFLTIVLMPLTYSIANGVAFGLIAHVLIHAFTGKGRQLHPILIGLAVILIGRYAWLAGG